MTEKQERGSIDNWNKTKIFYIVQCRYSLALSYQEEKEHEKENSIKIAFYYKLFGGCV